MKKSTLNFIIDGLMFICMAAITGIGLLIKYTLLSGQEARVVYGDRVDLFFLGMDRHEWGFIHLIFGYVLIGLIAIHVYLHWKFVTSIFKRMFEGRWVKKTIATTFIAVCTLLVVFPFIIKPKVVKNERGRGRRHRIDNVKTNQEKDKTNTYEIKERDRKTRRRGRAIRELE